MSYQDKNLWKPKCSSVICVTFIAQLCMSVQRLVIFITESSFYLDHNCLFLCVHTNLHKWETVCMCLVCVYLHAAHYPLTGQRSLLACKGLLAASRHIDFHLGCLTLRRGRTLILSRPISSPVLHLTLPLVCFSLWPGIHSPPSCTQAPLSQFSFKSNLS